MEVINVVVQLDGPALIATQILTSASLLLVNIMALAVTRKEATAVTVLWAGLAISVKQMSTNVLMTLV